MSFDNFMNYDSDGFCFTGTVGGFLRCVKFIDPVELYLKYPDCQKHIKMIDKSEDYTRYLIWGREVKSIVGFFLHSNKDKTLVSIYIKKEYRRLGLYKKSLRIAVNDCCGELKIKTDSESKIKDYLIGLGCSFISKFEKNMPDGYVREEL